MRYDKKPWEDMDTDEKLDLLRAEIKNLIEAVNATNLNLNRKFGRITDQLDARIKEVARDVQALREKREEADA